MAATRRQATTDLIEELLTDAASGFDFFQVVRLLERWFECKRASDGIEPRRPLGQSFDAGIPEEVAFVVGVTSLGHPPSDIVKVNRHSAGFESGGHERTKFEIELAAFALYGPNGALPYHYSVKLIELQRTANPGPGGSAMKAFLDVLNHRMAALYYRAWEKYRLPFAYERRRLSSQGSKVDPITDILHALVGLGGRAERSRLGIPSESIVGLAPAFARFPRSPEVLEAVLAEFLRLPVEVFPFELVWIDLPPEEVSELPQKANPDGQNCRLGVNLVVGSRVPDFSSTIRVRIGPLRFLDYRALTPGGARLDALCELLRLYVGVTTDFVIQPVLAADDVQPCELSTSDSTGSRLGYSTFLAAGDESEDFDGARFFVTGIGTSFDRSNR